MILLLQILKMHPTVLDLPEKITKNSKEYGINCMTCGNHIWDKEIFITTSMKLTAFLDQLNYPRAQKGVGSQNI